MPTSGARDSPCATVLVGRGAELTVEVRPSLLPSCRSLKRLCFAIRAVANQPPNTITTFRNIVIRVSIAGNHREGIVH